MLSEIEELLGKCGIECAFVEGSVFKKNKALTSFKAGNSKTKVILLSLEKAASGTNLVEASHIIFMGTLLVSVKTFLIWQS
jgi:SNF2 family DNA or RNA helicase